MSQVIDNSLIPKFSGLAILLVITSLPLVLKNKFIDHIDRIDLALLTYMLFHSLSIFWAINIGDAIYESLKIGLLFSLIQILRSFLKANKEAVYSAIAMASIFATVAAVSLSLNELAEAMRSKAPLSSSIYLVKSHFGHKNMFSNWLLFLLPFNLFGLYIKTKLPRILFIIVLAFQLIMIAILMTRAVYLATIVGLILFLIVHYKRSNKVQAVLKYSAYSVVFVLIISIILAAFDKLPHLIDMDSQASSSAVERLVVWSKTIDIIKDNLLLGVGAGNWKIVLPSQGVDGIRRAITGFTVFARPHNDYLWIWSEIGSIGFLAFLSFIYFTLKRGFNQLFLASNSILLLSFTGFISYLIIAFFDFPKERIESTIALAVFVAIIIVESPNNQKEIKSSKKLRAIIGSIMVGLLAFSVYFAQVRIASEKNLKLALTAKDASNHLDLVKYAYAAEHIFYSGDVNGLPIRYYSGIGHFNLNQKERAVEDFKLAFVLNPYNFNVVNNIATACFISQDYINAEKYYLEALNINPYFDDAKLNLAATYINTGQKEQANYYLNQVSQNSERLQQLKALAQ